MKKVDCHLLHFKANKNESCTFVKEKVQIGYNLFRFSLVQLYLSTVMESTRTYHERNVNLFVNSYLISFMIPPPQATICCINYRNKNDKLHHVSFYILRYPVFRTSEALFTRNETQPDILAQKCHRPFHRNSFKEQNFSDGPICTEILFSSCWLVRVS